MEPTIKEFLETFPEFSCLPNGRLTFIFNTALTEVGESNYCENQTYRMAVYLLTAHNATVLDPENAKNGKVTSEKVGDVSVSYKQGDDDFSSTQYGLQYMKLAKQNVIGAQVL